jgi:hypothetical protein
MPIWWWILYLPVATFLFALYLVWKIVEAVQTGLQRRADARYDCGVYYCPGCRAKYINRRRRHIAVLHIFAGGVGLFIGRIVALTIFLVFRLWDYFSQIENRRRRSQAELSRRDINEHALR